MTASSDIDGGPSFSRVGSATDRPSRLNVIQQRLAAPGMRTAIDSAMGMQPSWAQKLSEGTSGCKLGDIPALLDGLGLKIVDKSQATCDAEAVNAASVLLSKLIQHVPAIMLTQVDPE